MENGKQVDILYVEDDPNDAELALRALKKNNLANNLVHVQDGEAALDFLLARGEYRDRIQDGNPKVILLDLNLPKVSGLEVLKAVRADAGLRFIPVIIMTSSREEKDLIASYELGVNSYIVKPVDFEKFVEAVREIGLYWLLLNEHP